MKTILVILLIALFATAVLAQPTPVTPVIFGTPQAPPWAGATIVLETPLPFMATYTPTPTGEPDLPEPTIPVITIGELDDAPPYFVIQPLPDWVIWIIRPLLEWSYR